MDTELIREERHMESLCEGDIIIKTNASFRDILDVLELHARAYLGGNYSRERIVDELKRSI